MAQAETADNLTDINVGENIVEEAVTTRVMDEFRLVPLEKIVEWKEPRDFSHEDVA